ncbi:MAG: hypothetical protein DDT40_01839 [candidate division WS2 bacterium]|nr:hypothetical protein [Candidatus Psychracetigena formicireducens]
MEFKTVEVQFLDSIVETFELTKVNNPMVQTLLISFRSLFKIIDTNPTIQERVGKILTYIQENWTASES